MPRSNIDPRGNPLPLSRRQKEVLYLIAEGKADKEIAHLLDMSPGHVKNCVQDIRARLKAASRSHAVGIALRDSLIKFPG